MSTTHPARRALVCLGAVLAIVTAGCSSSGDPVPGNTTSTGSSTPMAMDTKGAAGAIDRTDPAAVAAAFATYFAAGDTPSACKLAAPEGVKQITSNWGGASSCTSRQPWATTVTLYAHCSNAAHKEKADYIFRTPGVEEIGSNVYLDVELTKASSQWAVSAAAGADSGGGALPCGVGHF